MTFEQVFFLKTISDYLNRKKTSQPSDCIDWNSVLFFANIQQVEGIFFYQCKSFLPKDIFFQLQDKYCSSMQCFANQEYYLKKIEKSLKARNIECFSIKGLSVASFYPMPALRTMGDIDVVVRPEDRSRVHRILLEQGYVNISRKKNREWIYCIGKYELELHDRLIYGSPTNRSVYEEFLNSFWDYVHNGVLDWNYHFVFLILHLRKHLMTSGVGFRQFMDIAVVTKNNSNLNWSWIEEQLVKLDLLQFTKNVYAFIERWFGIQSPIEISEFSSGFYILASEQIFNNGVFGFNNPDNKTNLVVNNARKSKHPKFSMFISAVQSVFPSYSSMVSVPTYRFIKGKKWLLPIAWIYRIIKGANNSDFMQNVSTVKSSFVSMGTIMKREEYLRQWGLYDVD